MSRLPDEGPIPVAEEFEPYRTAIAAMDLANLTRAELADQVRGALRSYVLDVQAQAVTAMAELTNADPTNAFEIIQLQKTITAYNHVMLWVQRTFDAGEQASADWLEDAEYREQQEDRDVT